jgi:hypothetical protein
MGKSRSTHFSCTATVRDLIYVKNKDDKINTYMQNVNYLVFNKNLTTDWGPSKYLVMKVGKFHA